MEIEKIVEDIKNSFTSIFAKEPDYLFSCGGRFEILGNHTDHNHGLCLASACDLQIIAAVNKNDSKEVNFQSLRFDPDELDLSDLEPRPVEYASSKGLIRGVAAYLKEHGYKIGGFNAYSESSIFKGAGVSSSAAFELLVGHIFNVLYNDNKQIIISSDRSPNDLKSLEDRLKTRFCWGLTVDVYPPELDLRKNILRKKIQSSNLLPEIDDEVIEYIAANMASDVRKLEGAINRLMAESLTMGYEKINLPIAVNALKTMINKGTSEKTNILRVQKAVADYYKISVDDIKSKKKSATIVGARQIAMYLSREILNESFERIGLEFGGRDHSTVMYAYDKIKEEINTSMELKNIVEKIKENIL